MLKIITAWSRYEYVVFFIALLLGSVIWAIVQGVVCGIITTGDPCFIEHRQNMDALNFLMEDMKVDMDIRVRVRDYYRQTQSLLKRQSYNGLVELLSPQLSTDVRVKMGEVYVSAVWWLQGCLEVSPSFVSDVIARMEVRCLPY